jgi:hypothetical protein
MKCLKLKLNIKDKYSIPVAARSKAWVCGRLVDGIAGSNPARSMDVCLLCLYVVLCCVGRGLCVGLITRPEESYRASNCMCLRNFNKEEDKAQVWAVFFKVGWVRPKPGCLYASILRISQMI